MKSGARFLTGLLATGALVAMLTACGAPPSNGDAAPDVSGSDSSGRMDSTPGADSAGNPDSASGNDVATMTDSAAGSDAVTMSDASAMDSASTDAARDASSDASSSTDGASAMDGASTDAARDASSDASSDAGTGTDAASAMDSASTDAASPADSGVACTVQGDWTTTVMMSFMLAFRFRADGTWEGATSPTQLGTAMAIPTGNYSTATGTIVLTNDPGGSGCVMSDRGEYRITYDPSCGTMVWTLVSDTCAGRASAINGATFRRYTSDAGVPDAGADASTEAGVRVDGGACSMLSSWSTTFGPGGAMMMAAMRFNAGGTWDGATSVAALMGGMVIPLGNYSETSGRIVLTDDPGTGSGCTMTDRGEYSIVYAPDCRTARWTLVSDTCTGRSTALNGASFTRL